MMVQENPCDDRSFEQAAEHLKLLGEMKDQSLLEDALFQEFRALALAQMRRALTETPVEGVPGTAAPSRGVAPSVVAHLHAQPNFGPVHQEIVNQISKSYDEAGDDERQFMLRALAALGDQHLLNPGDSADLTRLIDIASGPGLPDEATSNSQIPLLQALLAILGQLHEINAKVSQNPAASPTSLVLVQVTVQSGQRAAEEIRTKAGQTPAFRPRALWQLLVQEDLKGGLVGAGAAGSLLAAPALMLGPIGLSTVGAAGALIGAGVSSGLAWHRREKLGPAS